MSANTFSEQSNGRSGVVKRIFQSLLHVILLALILAALIFIPAGSDHLDWGMAWILLGVYSTGLFVTFLLLNLCDPDLARERAKIQEGTNTTTSLHARVGRDLSPGGHFDCLREE
jgi:hypothetical protein